MSSNGNDCLTSSSSDDDLFSKYYVNNDYNCLTPKYYLYDFNEENIKEKIKVLEKEIKEILRRLNFLESIIENGLKK